MKLDSCLPHIVRMRTWMWTYHLPGSTLDETRQRLNDFAILMWDTYASDTRERPSERKEKVDHYV